MRAGSEGTLLFAKVPVRSLSGLEVARRRFSLHSLLSINLTRLLLIFLLFFILVPILLPRRDGSGFKDIEDIYYHRPAPQDVISLGAALPQRRDHSFGLAWVVCQRDPVCVSPHSCLLRSVALSVFRSLVEL